MSCLIQQKHTVIAALSAAVLLAFSILLKYDGHHAYYYDDETIAVNVIRYMEENSSLDTNWNNADWGGTWTPFMFDYDQYNFSSWLTSQYYLKQLTGLFFKPEPLLLYRIYTLLFHLLALLLIMYGAWRWLGLQGAILSGSFFALTPMFMIDTHYARPETFLTLITALGIFIHIEQEYRHKALSLHDGLAGLAWGIAITCKISTIPLAALFLARRLWMTKSVAMVIYWLTGATIAVAIFAPYLFINPSHIVNGANFLFQQYMNSGENLAHPDIIGIYLLFFIGPVSILAIIYSIATADQALKITTQILLTASFFYLIFFSLATFINESNISHMASAWSWMFATGSLTLFEQIKKLPRAKHFATVFLCAALLPSIIISIDVYRHVFMEPGKIQKQVREYEKQLMKQFHVSSIIPVESAPTGLLQSASIPEDILLRVSLTRCYNHEKTINFLDQQSFLRRVDEMTLPLHYLPCSNKIDTIHFPPGYLYYKKASDLNAADKIPQSP